MDNSESSLDVSYSDTTNNSASGASAAQRVGSSDNEPYTHATPVMATLDPLQEEPESSIDRYARDAGDEDDDELDENDPDTVMLRQHLRRPRVSPYRQAVTPKRKSRRMIGDDESPTPSQNASSRRSSTEPVRSTARTLSPYPPPRPHTPRVASRVAAQPPASPTPVVPAFPIMVNAVEYESMVQQLAETMPTSPEQQPEPQNGYQVPVESDASVAQLAD